MQSDIPAGSLVRTLQNTTTNHFQQQNHDEQQPQQQAAGVITRQSSNNYEEAKSVTTTTVQQLQHNHRLVSLHEEVAGEGVLLQHSQEGGPVAPISGSGGGPNHEVSALARVVQSALSISALDSRAGTSDHSCRLRTVTPSTCGMTRNFTKNCCASPWDVE